MKKRIRDEKRRAAALWLLEQRKAVPVPRRHRTGVRALARCGGADTQLVAFQDERKRRTVVVAARANASTATYAKTMSDIVLGDWR